MIIDIDDRTVHKRDQAEKTLMALSRAAFSAFSADGPDPHVGTHRCVSSKEPTFHTIE